MNTIDPAHSTDYTPQRTLSLPLRLFLKLMKSSPLVGESVTPDITRLLSSYSSVYCMAIGDGKYALFDTGLDANATEIMRYLAAHGATPADVVAIFLTHGHPDHMAGIPLFPQATVYVSEGDREFVQGNTKSDGMLPGLSGKLKPYLVPAVDHIRVVQDGETVTVGDKHVRCFLVAGHTRGSMAYLADGALMIGDAVTFDPNGRAIKPPAPMSYDARAGVVSLRRLIEQLETNAVTPNVIVPSHSGGGTLDAIRDLVAKSPR